MFRQGGPMSSTLHGISVPFPCRHRTIVEDWISLSPQSLSPVYLYISSTLAQIHRCPVPGVAHCEEFGHNLQQRFFIREAIGALICGSATAGGTGELELVISSLDSESAVGSLGKVADKGFMESPGEPVRQSHVTFEDDLTILVFLTLFVFWVLYLFMYLCSLVFGLILLCQAEPARR